MNYDKYQSKLINVFTAVKCAVENDDSVSLRSFIKTFGVDPGHTITLLKQHELLECTGVGNGAHWKWTGAGKATIEEVARKIVEQKKATEEDSVERLAHYRAKAIQRLPKETNPDWELERQRYAINILIKRIDQADKDLRSLAAGHNERLTRLENSIGFLRENLKPGDRSVPARLAKIERYVGWLQKNLGDDSVTAASPSDQASSAPPVDTTPPINGSMRFSA